MISRVVWFIINKLIKKEGQMMMAMFFAQRVILGKADFDGVPEALKRQVAEILVESGLEDLVPEAFR